LQGRRSAVVAAPWSPQLQPHLGSNVKRLVGVVWSSRISCGCGIFGSSRSFIDSSSFFFVFGTNVAVLTHLSTSYPQPTTSDRLREERQRRRDINTVWRLLLKDLVVIFVFLGCFILFGVSFNARVLFAKKKDLNITSYVSGEMGYIHDEDHYYEDNEDWG
jgi:hypothetical protein